MEEVISAMDAATSADVLRAALARTDPHDHAQLERLGIAYGRAVGSQLVLLVAQRRLLAQLEETGLADWDHPDIERENHHRCRALLEAWRTGHALLARAITGDPVALEHAMHRPSRAHRALLTAGFTIAAAAAGLLGSSALDPRLFMIAIASVVMAVVAARHGAYAPSRAEPADATGLRLLEAAFVSGVRAHDAESARRASLDLGDWLARVEADVLARDQDSHPGGERAEHGHGAREVGRR